MKFLLIYRYAWLVSATLLSAIFVFDQSRTISDPNFGADLGSDIRIQNSEQLILDEVR